MLSVAKFTSRPDAAFGTAQPAHELISGVHRVHDSDACATAHSVLEQMDGHNLSRCSISNRDAVGNSRADRDDRRASRDAMLFLGMR